MSITDQLYNIPNSIESSIANNLGLTPNRTYYYNTFGDRNHILIKPLDVSSSKLFQNLSSKELLNFTPELNRYYDTKLFDGKTGYPVERGVVLDAGILKGDSASSKPKYGKLRDTNDILRNDIPNAFIAFNDEPGQEFLHNLDKNIPIGLNNTNDIYLTSTRIDNEDPISFGYDIIINYDNSPLFNGSIEDFITTFSNYTEIKTRLGVITEFKKNFFKFFKVNTPASLNLTEKTFQTNTGSYNVPIIRTYYLKKITGLDNLTENILPDKSRQFVNYGANDDVLTLTLNEDVDVNTGYLAALYKILSYSKLRGKKIIPENLLRFDMEIVVTEARKFNRVNKKNDTLEQYADLISRYRYTLYECQLFFDKMSHGDSIDMWGLDTSSGFDIKINYKFSTVNFEKISDYDFDTNIVELNGGSKTYLNNKKSDLTKIEANEATNFSINAGSLVMSPIQYKIEKYSPYIPDTGTTPDFYKQRLENLENVKNVKNINLRDALLEKTLDNINQQVGIGFLNVNLIGGQSGFTKDGYEYNLPAYYANKLMTTGDIGKVLSVLKPIFNSVNIYSTAFDSESHFRDSLLLKKKSA